MKKLSAFFVMLILMMAAGVCVHAADFSVESFMLPTANAYEEYNNQIKMKAGNEGYTFEFVSGLKPEGLTINSDGSITGIPTSYGTYSMINVRISHTDGTSAVVEFIMIVMPRKVHVDVSAPANVSYDGNYYTAEVKCYDVDGNLLDDLVPRVTYGDEHLTAVKNAKKYYISVALPSGYMIYKRTGDKHLIINPIRAEISVEGKTVPYDGQPHGITASDVTVNPEEAGYIVKYRKEGAAGYTSDVPVSSGRYEARVQTANLNYETVYATATITILSHGISFTVDNASVEYDGAMHGATVTPSEEVDFTVLYTDSDGNTVVDSEGNPCNPTNAGVYKIVIKFANPDAYSIDSISSSTFTITRKPLKFILEQKSFPYTGSPHTPSFVFEPSIDSSLYTVTYKKQGEEQDLTNITDAGVYDVMVNLANDNYILTEDSDKTVEIAGMEVNFTVTNNEYVWNGEAHTADIASEPEILPEDYTVIYTNSNGEIVENPIDADTYTISIEMNNHGYILGTITPNQLIITPQIVNFSTDAADAFVYDGTTHTVNVTSEPEISSEEYTVIYTNSNGEVVENPTNADTYTISIEIKNSGYAVGTITPDKLIINPKTISFDVSNNNLPYDGKAHTANVTTESDIPQDAYTVEYADSEGNRTDSVINVGEYNIIITITNKNYILSEDFNAIMTIISSAVMNIGNSPAAMIYKDTTHAEDVEWQTAALEYFRENRKFSEEYLPEGCRLDIQYGYINNTGDIDSSLDIDSDKNTVFVKKLESFVDPGILVDGTIVYGNAPVQIENIENLYEVVYPGDTPDEVLGRRYVAVIGKIGDINGDGAVNAVDANYINYTEKSVQNVIEARVWDVNKDGIINKNDADAIRNRFKNPLIPYYPWI